MNTLKEILKAIVGFFIAEKAKEITDKANEEIDKGIKNE